MRRWRKKLKIKVWKWKRKLKNKFKKFISSDKRSGVKENEKRR